MKKLSAFSLVPSQLLFDPRGQPTARLVVIIVFAHVVRPSVRPSLLFKTKQIQAKTMFTTTTGEALGLAEWIIDDTCLGKFVLELP